MVIVDQKEGKKKYFYEEAKVCLHSNYFHSFSARLNFTKHVSKNFRISGAFQEFHSYQKEFLFFCVFSIEHFWQSKQFDLQFMKSHVKMLYFFFILYLLFAITSIIVFYITNSFSCACYNKIIINIINVILFWCYDDKNEE